MSFAFVFPGQGSQAVGMLADLLQLSVVKYTIQEASDALDQNLMELMTEGPIEQLNLTFNTQPIMLVASVAFYRAWFEMGGTQPAVMAGHSLGEYSALTAAGVFSLTDAVRLVRIRAMAMQNAVPVGVGAMAAILGMSAEDVVQVCAQTCADNESGIGIVEAVNFNTPMQVVIAGHVEMVEKACQLAKSKGAKRALMLPVSAPFHSSLMEPSAAALRGAFEFIPLNEPQIPIVNNVDVQIESDVNQIKDALMRQAWNPVQWVDSIKKIADMGITQIVECGPGKVLTSLNNKIDARLTGHALVDYSSFENIIEQMKKI